MRYHKLYMRGIAGLLTMLLLAGFHPATAQQPVGIGTTTPDSKAALDITSTTKGVLFPRLTTAQQTVLSGILTAAEKGMMVTDATTGKLVGWTGSVWASPAPSAAPSALAPLSLTANNFKINAGTNVGDLLTWDGNNWVNKQPPVQHFSVSVDNHQPYLAANYVISLFGVFPSQNDASTPFVGEIYLMGCNFAPTGWQFCDGSLLSIANNTVLFALIGTTYGGNGVNTYAVPDLRGRVPMHQGSNGTSSYTIGQSGGTESKTFAQ